MIEERKLFLGLVDDTSTLPTFIDYFEKEASEAKEQLEMSGKKIESISKKIPVIMDQRFTQLQILNAAVEHFEKMLDVLKSKYFRKYLENYPRSLSSRDVEKYVAGEKEVVDMAMIINEIALMRNVFISITKGIDAMSFQINNITKLRTAGLDDASID